jgi:6-bladed beta-propeller protein
MLERWTQHDHLFATGGRGPHRIKISPYDPERHVWVVDDSGQRVFKFTHDGKKLMMTLGEAGVRGTDEKHFGGPTDLGWLPDGTFFVADGYVNSRIVKFDKNGKFLKAWGTKGIGPGEFNLPHGIDIDRNRRVYVADAHNSRIQLFDENGKFLDQWPNIWRPDFIMVSADQHLWIAAGATDMMLKYDLNGKLLEGWGKGGTALGAFQAIHAFGVDSGRRFLRRRSGRGPDAEVYAEARRRPGEARRAAASCKKPRADRHCRTHRRHGRATLCRLPASRLRRRTTDVVRAESSAVWNGHERLTASSVVPRLVRRRGSLTSCSCPRGRATSYVGPLTFRSPFSSVHGAAKVGGSATVSRYWIVSAATRVNRSTRWSWRVAPRKRRWSLKFVVSTTSVRPSQRPRESPSHRPMREPTCGRPLSGIMRTSCIISVRMTTYPGVWMI